MFRTSSDIESTSLQNTWHHLAASRKEGSHPLANGQLVLSTDSTGNEWAVTFCRTRCRDVEKMAVGMRYLDVRESNQGGPEASVTLAFDCLEGDDCLPLWPAMVEELAKAVLAASEPLKRGKALKDALEEWADWWPHGKALSDQRKMGLVGELAFLERLAGLAGPKIAIQSWKGPDGENQDFCIGTTAFEVKCQNAKGVVEIANLNQLDDSRFTALYLISCRLISDGSRQLSLQERRDAISRQIGADAALESRFTRSLAKAGWFSTIDTQREERHEVRLTVYQVSPGFPRMLKNNPLLPCGVILKSYKVDLGRCRNFMMDDDSFQKVVTGLRRGH